MSDYPCISVAWIGGWDEVTLATFASEVIQDDQVALEIARTMLDNMDEDYGFNTEPEANHAFAQFFSVIHEDELRAQIKEMEAEYA